MQFFFGDTIKRYQQYRLSYPFASFLATVNVKAQLTLEDPIQASLPRENVSLQTARRKSRVLLSRAHRDVTRFASKTSEKNATENDRRNYREHELKNRQEKTRQAEQNSPREASARTDVRARSDRLPSRAREAKARDWPPRRRVTDWLAVDRELLCINRSDLTANVRERHR